MYFLHPYKALTSNTTCVSYVRALLSSLLGGGPLIFGSGSEAVLSLSGFRPDDWPAVNFLALLIYQWKKGVVDLPPTAAAPVVNERAFNGAVVSLDGADPYFDFLTLRTEEAREITAFYHKARPRVVAVFLGGKEFEIAATTEAAAQVLTVRRITPSPHTPEGAFTLKYSHGLVFRIPQRDFHVLTHQVADILKSAASLPPVQRREVKVAKKEIYLLHGGRETDDGVVIDNEVYVYI